jgi:hypothetical protein
LKPPAPHTIALAAVVPAAFLYFWPTGWDHLWSYAASLPVIVLCASSIVRLRSSPLALSAAALSFSIPAVGYGMTKQLIAIMDMQYLDLHRGAEHALAVMSVAAEGVGPLLIAGGLAGLLLGARRIGGMLALGGGLSVLAHRLIYIGLGRLQSGDFQEAATFVFVAEELRFLPLLCCIYLMRGCDQLKKWLLAVAGLLGMWLVAPPVWLQMGQLDQGLPHPKGPVGTLGQGIAMPSADPSAADFSTQLDAQKTHRIYGEWWCNAQPSPTWKTDLRAASGLAMAESAEIAELRPQLPEIFRRGIYLLAFVGSAKETVPPPLGLQLEYPAARFLLEPPPPTASFAVLRSGVPEWLDDWPREASTDACAWWAPWETTFGDLFHLGQTWSNEGRCAGGIFLLFGEPTPTPRVWHSPVSCG